MNLKNIDIVKNRHKDKIILVKQGNFMKSVGDDAIIMSHLFEYKLNPNGTVGFPVGKTDAIVNRLKSFYIGSVIVGENDQLSVNNIKDSNYEASLILAKKVMLKNKKQEKLFEIICEKISNDEDNIKKLEEFVNEL